MEGTERRQYPRADLVFKIRYQDLSNSDIPEELIESVSKDISAGGISIETAKEKKSGELLKLAFSFEELPGEIEATAEVVRSWQQSGRYFAALKFLAIHPSDLEIVADYVNQYFSGPEEK